MVLEALDGHADRFDGRHRPNGRGLQACEPGEINANAATYYSVHSLTDMNPGESLAKVLSTIEEPTAENETDSR